MKLGAENRNTVIIAAVLGVFALVMIWRTFFSGGEIIAGKPPAPAQVSPAIATAGPAARRIRGRRAPNARPQPTVTASLDPRLRFDLLKGSADTEYRGSGRNIFRAEAEPVIPPVVKNPVIETKNATPDVPPVFTPPPPPPINMKFFGLLNRPGEPRQAFLLQNDEVFVAKEGEVVNRRYKVLKINNNSVEIEDLLANNKQVVPLTAG
jgi:hypothetical protein